MARRKGWDALSQGVRGRYERKGITAERYASGESLQAARGHASTPEHRPWRARAAALDIESVIPDFWELPVAEGLTDAQAKKALRDEQERLSEAWVTGFFKKGQGKIVNPKRKRGEKIRRQTSVAQEGFKMDIRNHMREFMDGDYKESELWNAFRDIYKNKFS